MTDITPILIILPAVVLLALIGALFSIRDSCKRTAEALEYLALREAERQEREAATDEA